MRHYETAAPPQPMRVVMVRDGLATPALVVGLVSFIVWPASLLAVVFGLVAWYRCDTQGYGGKGSAIAGAVLGAVVATPLILITTVLLW